MDYSQNGHEGEAIQALERVYPAYPEAQRQQGHATTVWEPQTVIIIFVLCKLANQDRYKMSDTELRWKVRHAGI